MTDKDKTGELIIGFFALLFVGVWIYVTTPDKTIDQYAQKNCNEAMHYKLEL